VASAGWWRGSRRRHTVSYWLLLDISDAIPKENALRHTEFNTTRLRLVKIVARVVETSSRIRVALASCCPDAAFFRAVALGLMPCGP
jgi:hypothetical protein